MKSNVCPLTGQEGELENILREVDKCTAYNALDSRSALRTRLFAEELVGMLPELLKNAEGVFWIENEGNRYEMHISMNAKATDFFTREKLLAISKSGKNAAHKGFMGKIRAITEMMLFPADGTMVAYDFAGCDVDPTRTYAYSWTLKKYEKNISDQDDGAEKTEAWDELEKSIIARLADDVIVGIDGKKVDIIVCKEFKD